MRRIDDLNNAIYGTVGYQARQLRRTAEVPRAALNCAARGQSLGSGNIPGCQLDERALRFGLERCYRAQARLVPGLRRRVKLVGPANMVRPGTWS